MFVRINKENTINTDAITSISCEFDENGDEYPARVFVSFGSPYSMDVAPQYRNGLLDALSACNSEVLVASRAVRQYDSPGWFLK